MIAHPPLVANERQKKASKLNNYPSQSIRNEADLEAISCPRKYLNLGTFHKYYSGECQVPVPTIFIGGNHEAMNHLWEL